MNTPDEDWKEFCKLLPPECKDDSKIIYRLARVAFHGGQVSIFRHIDKCRKDPDAGAGALQNFYTQLLKTVHDGANNAMAEAWKMERRN